MSLAFPSALEEMLYESYLTSGEVHDAATVAEIVLDFEKSAQRTASPEEIYTAIRQAGERFVDSMVANENETWNDHLDAPDANCPKYDNEEQHLRYLAQWEAQRPSTVRKAELLKILSAVAEKAPQIRLLEVLDHANRTITNYSARAEALENSARRFSAKFSYVVTIDGVDFPLTFDHSRMAFVSAPQA